MALSSNGQQPAREDHDYLAGICLKSRAPDRSTSNQPEHLINMTACEKVLRTYELLDNILAFVSPWDIGSAVLVSRAWCDVIHRSEDIPTATALAPAPIPASNPTPAKTIPRYGIGSRPAFNPILKDHGIAEFWRSDESEESRYYGPSKSSVVRAVITASGCERLREVQQYDYAFLVSPPVKAVAVVAWGSASGGLDGMLANGSGVRVGDLRRARLKVSGKTDSPDWYTSLLMDELLRDEP